MKRGLLGGDTISETACCAKGKKLHGHSFTQGISPFDERAGVAEWQTSRVPIIECPPSAIVSDNEGGTMMLRATARRTIIAFHLIDRTIKKKDLGVNVKL